MNSPLTNVPALRQDGGEDAVDLFRMLRSIWVRKWAILALSGLVASATSFWISSRPPVYEARATLLIEEGENNVVQIKDVYQQSQGVEYMQTQFELLRSRMLAERVVRKLQLQNLQRFMPTPPPPKPWYKFDLSSLKPPGLNPTPPKPWTMPPEEDRIQDLTDQVAGNVKIQQIGDSNLVALTYRDDSAKLAATIANTYLEEYIDSFFDSKLQTTMKANSWMQGRLDTLKQNLKSSEDRLQAFREREKFVDVQGVTTKLSAQQISSISTTYQQSRQRRQDLEATEKELERLKGHSVDELLTIPSLANHESIRRLKQVESDAQRNLSELSKRYGPKHPKIAEAKAQASSARSALESEVRNVEYSIGREYRQALDAENASKSQFDATNLDLQDTNRKEFQLKDLEREVETNSQFYDRFFNRLKETDEIGVFEAPPGRIIDTAQEGSEVGLNIRESAMMAFMVTLALACGLAILLDTLENTLKSPSEVEERLGVPILGTLPLMKGGKAGEFEEYWQNSKSEFAEAIRTIRTGVVLSGLDKPARIIVVTSSVPGEGKSTLTLNLAAAFGQMERTLVVGADLRRPSLARRCNLPAKHPGLSNFVAGSAELDECIAQFGESNLSVMPAGIIPSNPLEMLSSRRFRDALETLKNRFDRIVIDSAPVAAVSDALMLASYADALIFVIKADATAASLAKKSIGQLENANAMLTGVVLNHFDPKRLTKYYESYNYRYGGGYYNSVDSHG
ncbi:MAG TPA: polysaccharide biosynthesis tyrosine autokinase [Candidatus Acidoferrum sp.]|nr:polysaccharide biosynthesis tyrosine autokinase [Candidatus Acidoferrum sp.]